jgi:hypothetical protein
MQNESLRRRSDLRPDPFGQANEIRTKPVAAQRIAEASPAI